MRVEIIYKVSCFSVVFIYLFIFKKTLCCNLKRFHIRGSDSFKAVALVESQMFSEGAYREVGGA